MTNSRTDAPTRRRALKIRCAALGVALLLPACHATPDPVLVPPGRPDDAVSRLRDAVEARLAAPEFERATWGVLVRSLSRGDTLYAANAGKLLLPASGMKIVTLAVAADQLGWSYAYETGLSGTGPIAAGVLDGDLIVTGTGDPSIDDWDGYATALFRTWSDHLRTLGVHAVAGRLVGDDRAFGDDGLGAGWAWDDLGFGYAARVGALQFNQNTVQLVLAPGREVGRPATVRPAAPACGFALRNLLTTGVPGGPAVFSLLRPPGRTAVEVRGSLPQGTAPVVRNVSVHDPTLHFVYALRHALADGGVEVHGPAVDIDGLDEIPSRAVRLLTYRSPPLSVLAATMMRNSQNLYAETLLKTLGREAADEGTTNAGRRIAASILRSWGIPSDALRIADGSGLSRYNLATAEALVDVLGHVHRDAGLREPFKAALPAAGRDGTLERRLLGTAAENNVRAKTGSLSAVRSLTGYLRTADGEPLAFSIIANNFGIDADPVDAAIDAVVVLLAEFSRR